MRSLAARIPRQQSWAEWLGAHLPAELAGHVTSVVERGSELVVFADSAAWGTRLRYALAGLAPQISARTPAVRRTRVRVGPGGAAS